jgi:hypothetical protein
MRQRMARETAEESLEAETRFRHCLEQRLTAASSQVGAQSAAALSASSAASASERHAAAAQGSRAQWEASHATVLEEASDHVSNRVFVFLVG